MLLGDWGTNHAVGGCIAGFRRSWTVERIVGEVSETLAGIGRTVLVEG